MELDSQDAFDDEESDASTYYRHNGQRYAKPASSRRNYSDQGAGPITHTTGFVGAVNAAQTITVQLEGDLLIPKNYGVEIETSSGQRFEGIVTEASVGKVILRSTGFPIKVRQGEMLQFGVIAAYPDGI